MRRTTAAIAGLLLVFTSACAGDDPGSPPQGASKGTGSASTTAGGTEFSVPTQGQTPTTSIPAPISIPGRAQGAGAAPPASTTSPPRTTVAISPAPGSNPSADPTVGGAELEGRPADDGSKGPPGGFARTLLRPQPASTLVFERAVHEGTDVAAATLNRNAGVLGDVSGKPVDVRPPIALAGGAQSWTAEQLRATADRVAKTPQGNGKAVLRLLIVRGSFEGDRGVLGAAIRGDVIVLFRDSISAASSPIVSSRTIEDAVLLHEIGHVLGLVDIALDTNREDPEHPGHSKSRESVMYWAVESDLIGQVLGSGPPNTFDAADLADLRALRGGA